MNIVCHTCGLHFHPRDLHTHLMYHLDNDESIDSDEYDSDDEEQPLRQEYYPCPTCGEEFTEEELNIHFLDDHMNRNRNVYDDLAALDTVKSLGFCGYDIMVIIGNICYYDFDSEPDSCPICSETYTNYDCFREATSSEINTRLYEEAKKYHPVLLNCCEQTICHQCFKKHCETAPNYDCPYCRKTFLVKGKFIYIPETNPADWILWKINNFKYVQKKI